ncbi:MAG: pseudouridine synthase, RluA family protein [Myxococcaceae bacterium]|nr:pseudouridine synthase, RluA family protein [Myxococcaceae bacterium]
MSNDQRDKQSPADQELVESTRAGDKPVARFVTVGAEHDGQRVDNYLRTELKGAPKSLVYRILRTGEVRVNKGRAKPDSRVHTGDVVRIPPLRLSEEVPVRVGESLEQALLAAVLYEDDQLLVLNKPSGLTVHAGSGVKVGVIEALRALRPESPGLELAHRLDRETSGVLVLAKDRPMLMELHELLRGDGVQKTYLTLVQGNWPDKLRKVDAPLEKNTLRGGERLVEVRLDGKQSLTLFKVVQRFAEATLVEAKPVTGRTHQIRVHAAHAGHPIAGDDKYGDPAFDRTLRSKGLQRLFLHAAKIELPRTSGRSLTIEAPLPADLAKVVAALRAELPPRDA